MDCGQAAEPHSSIRRAVPVAFGTFLLAMLGFLDPVLMQFYTVIKIYVFAEFVRACPTYR